MLRSSTLQTSNNTGTRGNVEPSSRATTRRPRCERGKTGGGSAKGPNSDRRWHSRHDDQDAQRSPRFPEDGAPSPTRPLATGTKSVPRYGLMVRASTRAPPMLPRLPGRNPKDRSSPGQTLPYAEVSVGLLATVLAFKRCPRASPHDRATLRTERRVEDSPQASPRFRVDQPYPAWLAELQPLFQVASGFRPLASGTWDKSSVLGLPATCYRASALNIGGCLPIGRRLASPRGVASGRSPRNGCHEAEGITRSPTPAKG